METKYTGFSRSFDAAVLAMANVYCPRGFDVSNDLDIQSIDGLREAVMRNGRMIVWGGASDKTIYGSPEVNYAYRAWHDACHLQGNFPFTLDGEQAATRLQIRQLELNFGKELALTWGLLLHCEAVEQTVYYLNTGGFLDDQRAFTVGFMQTITEGFPGLSWRDIRLACAGWDVWRGQRFTVTPFVKETPPFEAWEIPQVELPERRDYPTKVFRGRTVRPTVYTGAMA